MNSPDLNPDRTALRRRLLTTRQTWYATPDGAQAQAQLAERLWGVLLQLEPESLGIYCPMKGEFNPTALGLRAQSEWDCQLCLPFAQRQPVAMHYRPWDGSELREQDECGIATPSTKPMRPEVILVPCVGFTAEGYRLGYGGGYFDRYLSTHPDVTVIGVAWEQSLVSTAALSPQAHDLPLMAVVTEAKIWSPD